MNNPDWNHWRLRRNAQLWEIVALSLDADPDEVKQVYRKGFRVKADDQIEDEFRSRIINLADSQLVPHWKRLPEAAFKQYVSMNDVAPFLLSSGWNIPDELRAILTGPNGISMLSTPLTNAVEISKAPAPITPLRGIGSDLSATSQVSETRVPDWEFWLAMRKVQEWQACALSLNIDPDSMEHHPQGWMAGPGSGPIFTSDSFPSNEVKVKFEKRLRLLRANRHDQTIFTAPLAQGSGLGLNDILLSEFAAWGLSVGLGNMPSALIRIAEPVGIPADTRAKPTQPATGISAEEWKSLVEQDEQARKDPVYKATYNHATSLYDEEERLQEQLRQDHPYVDIEKKKRLSEIRNELADLGKVGAEAPISPTGRGLLVTTIPARELTPAERRAQIDITRERGARRRILEKWNDIEKEYGAGADSHQVLRVLKRDKDEKVPELKTVQNHLSQLRKERLIP